MGFYLFFPMSAWFLLFLLRQTNTHHTLNNKGGNFFKKNNINTKMVIYFGKCMIYYYSLLEFNIFQYFIWMIYFGNIFRMLWRQRSGRKHWLSDYSPFVDKSTFSLLLGPSIVWIHSYSQRPAFTFWQKMWSLSKTYLLLQGPQAGYNTTLI